MSSRRPASRLGHLSGIPALLLLRFDPQGIFMRFPTWPVFTTALLVSHAASAGVPRNAVPHARGPSVSNSGRFRLGTPAASARRPLPAGAALSPPALAPQTGAGGPRILYAPAEQDDPNYRGLIAARTGATVDYFDATTGTPSAETLASYQAVYTWPNAPYADAVTFGNRLADFADAGGTVILGPFCTYTQGYSLAGRIMSTGYSPVYSPTGDNHYWFSDYARDGTTCLYQGISDFSFGNSARDILAPLGSGQVDGHYRDGEIAIAYRPDLRVIYINGTGAEQLGEEVPEDFATLVGNAFLCSRPPAPPPSSRALQGCNRAGQLFWIDVLTGRGTYLGNLPTLATGRGTAEIEFDKLSGRAYVQCRDGVNFIQ